ncbi:MAG TPA: glycerol-3-phosphate dehydrogenase/oxidase, partial [Candidatus Thermoplasmatota archaeon]|nr:glycerol-3-phosphate dehydrogenase/oxidase [Candidatus Thermoplasmatota archaeon]
MEDSAGRTFDLLVIGGGINGSAIARDAALRGLSVCIVEGRDWGAGTSAKSSKLAHGGLRYLEQFELGLVHEALRDRERLLRQAPHLVHPLRFAYPIYPEVAARRAVRAGLLLYDLLSHGKSLPRRAYLGRRQALALLPGLEPKGLAGAATFHDAQIQHVERLVVEAIAQAQAHGAVALNHTRVTAILVEGGEGARRAVGVTAVGEDGARRTLRARAIVNATGCWVDEVLGPLAHGRPPKVRKTKGIHLVLPQFTDVAVMVRHRDGRSFFILPWQGQSILGTTDTDYDGDPFAATA